jgi:hypothetical protein
MCLVLRVTCQFAHLQRTSYLHLPSYVVSYFKGRRILCFDHYQLRVVHNSQKKTVHDLIRVSTTMGREVKLCDSECNFMINDVHVCGVAFSMAQDRVKRMTLGKPGARPHHHSKCSGKRIVREGPRRLRTDDSWAGNGIIVVVWVVLDEFGLVQYFDSRFVWQGSGRHQTNKQILLQLDLLQLICLISRVK